MEGNDVRITDLDDEYVVVKKIKRQYMWSSHSLPQLQKSYNNVVVVVLGRKFQLTDDIVELICKKAVSSVPRDKPRLTGKTSQIYDNWKLYSKPYSTIQMPFHRLYNHGKYSTSKGCEKNSGRIVIIIVLSEDCGYNVLYSAQQLQMQCESRFSQEWESLIPTNDSDRVFTVNCHGNSAGGTCTLARNIYDNFFMIYTHAWDDLEKAKCYRQSKRGKRGRCDKPPIEKQKSSDLDTSLSQSSMHTAQGMLSMQSYSDSEDSEPEIDMSERKKSRI